jgi:hypothetical protein
VDSFKGGFGLRRGLDACGSLGLRLGARGLLIGGHALDRLREKQFPDLCGVPDRNGSDRACQSSAHGTLPDWAVCAAAVNRTLMNTSAEGCFAGKKS